MNIVESLPFINAKTNKRILLAPMEGVIDTQMRELLTRIGHYDRCVTEFVRVTQNALPAKVFYRYCPELKNDGVTATGTPVFIQLLGGDPLMMAKSAKLAATLGALGIDLNFGCPAKGVNRSDGGSILLNEPSRVQNIVQAVRDAVPASIPVTVKIRLGVDNSDLLEEVATGIEIAGASELCVHARTRKNGYKPPAYWTLIHPIQEQLKIPVISNGEIWSVENAQQARLESGCDDLMLGRSALSCPDLSKRLNSVDNHIDYTPLVWAEILELVAISFANTHHSHAKHIGNRIKQWLVFLKRQYPEASALFQLIKPLKSVDDINEAIDAHRRNLKLH